MQAQLMNNVHLQGLRAKKQKMWSSGRALGSQLEGRGFNPCPMLDGSSDKAMPGSIPAPNAGSLQNNKRNTGSQMGHTKKYFFKGLRAVLRICMLHLEETLKQPGASPRTSTQQPPSSLDRHFFSQRCQSLTQMIRHRYWVQIHKTFFVKFCEFGPWIQPRK